MQTLARGLRDDVDAGFQLITFVDQAHLSATTAEQLFEQLAEILIYLFERIAETLTRATFDLAQRLFRRGDSTGDVIALGGQESQTLFIFR